MGTCYPTIWQGSSIGLYGGRAERFKCQHYWQPSKYHVSLQILSIAADCEETAGWPPLKSAAQLSGTTLSAAEDRSNFPRPMLESKPDPLASVGPTTHSMDSTSSNLTRLSSGVLPPPRLNVGVFSKRKGVRYHRDGQVRSCRFCEILRTRAEAFLYEDEHVVVFRPLRPIVPSHVLIVPRAHIRNVNRLAARHRGLLARMHRVAESVMTQGPENECVELQPEGLEVHVDENPVRYSFHVPPFNSIDHVHMHAFHDDPRSLGYYGRIKYRTESWWCRSYDQVMARLTELADVQQDGADEIEESSSSSGLERLTA